MTADFSIRINRREGSLEIEGPDKDWITKQLDRLSVVYESPPPTEPSSTGTKIPASGATEKAATKSGGGSNPPSRTRRSGGRGAHRASMKPELDQALTPELRSALEDYKEERMTAWKSNPNQAAIIATFLMDNVDWGGWIDEDDLYTVYSVMGWTGDAPSNYRSQINNARQRNGYFGRWAEGRVQLTHAGERFGRADSKSS